MSIVVHAGMPKTGTTSLQMRLAESVDALRAQGIDYPSRFRNQEDIAHHWLGDALCASDSANPAEIEAFLRYVDKSDAAQILVSSEGITNAINVKHCLRMLNFLRQLGSPANVKLVIVLRRIDSFLESMYLHSTKIGETRTTIDEYIVKRYKWARSFFTALSVIQKVGVARVQLIKLEATPQFDDLVLQALHLQRHTIPALAPARRLNEKLSWKSQLVLLHLAELEQDLRVALPRAQLIKALGGELTFVEDLPYYTVLSEDQEGYLREGALAAAHSVGFPTYLEFFDGAPPTAKPRVRLERSALTKDDFDRLRTWSKTTKPIVTLRARRK